MTVFAKQSDKTLLTLQVKRDYMCLYCNERCHPFSSLEAVRKHMAAKGHCKVHYGDGGEDEEGELEEFYDYSSRFSQITSYILLFPCCLALIHKKLRYFILIFFPPG